MIPCDNCIENECEVNGYVCPLYKKCQESEEAEKMIGSSYDEYGWSNIYERRDGYNKAIEDITEHIQKMKSYYTDGIMCSMPESIIGENVCDDILKYLKEMQDKLLNKD